MSLRVGAVLSELDTARFSEAPPGRRPHALEAAALPPSAPEAAARVVWAASLAAQAGRHVVPIGLEGVLSEGRTAADVRERIDRAVACGANATRSVALRRNAQMRTTDIAWADALDHTETYARRLCWAMRLGREHAPVALVCTGDDPDAEDPFVVALLLSMLRAQIPVHVLPRGDVGACRVEGTKLRKGLASYRLVVVPPGGLGAPEGPSATTLRCFASSGGLIVDGTGGGGKSAELPAAWVAHRGPPEVARLTSVVATHVERAIPPRFRLAARQPGTLLAKRRDSGQASILWLCNTGALPQVVELELAEPLGRADLLRPETGEVAEMPSLFGVVRPQLEPGCGLLLRLSAAAASRRRSSWFGHGPGNRTWVHLGGDWRITRSSPNLAALALTEPAAQPSASAGTPSRIAFRFGVEAPDGLVGISLVVLGSARPEVARVGPRALRSWRRCDVHGARGWQCPLGELPGGDFAGHVTFGGLHALADRVVFLLQGEFEARRESGAVTIRPPRGRAPLADWRTAGLDDYTGLVDWEHDVDLAGSPPFVVDIAEQAPRFRSVCDLWIDESPAGRRWWPPYETDITALVRGDTARVRYRTQAPIPRWRRFLAGARVGSDGM